MQATAPDQRQFPATAPVSVMGKWLCRIPCPAGEKLKFSSFDSFKRMCTGRYKQSNDDDVDFEQKHWSCEGCETGKAVLEGRLTEMPANAEKIEMYPWMAGGKTNGGKYGS